MCGGSPLIVSLFFVVVCLSQFRVGEIHRVVRILYSRSPLSEPVFILFVFLCLIQLTGRFTGELRYYTLVLPSLNRKTLPVYGPLIQHVGEITQGRFVTLILPL